MTKKQTKPTNESVSERDYIGSYQCAGFWRRAAAYVVDALLLTAVGLLVFLGLDQLFLLFSGVSLFLFDAVLADGLVIEVAAQTMITLMVAVFLSSKWQATPGKRLMKLFVMDINQKRIPFWKGVLRTFLPSVIGLLIATQVARIDAQVETRLDLESRKVIQVYASFYRPLLSHSAEGFYDFLTSSSGWESYERLERIIPMAQWQQMNYEVTTLKEHIKEGYKTELLLWFLAWLVIMAYWYGRLSFSYQKTTVHDALLGTRVVIGRPKT